MRSLVGSNTENHENMDDLMNLFSSVDKGQILRSNVIDNDMAFSDEFVVEFDDEFESLPPRKIVTRPRGKFDYDDLKAAIGQATFQRRPEVKVLLPDVVTRNKGFFGALAQIGVYAIGPKIDPVREPHQRRFNLLNDVTFMYGPYGNIQTFLVPQLGCEFLSTDIYSKLSFFDGTKVTGNTVDVCYGMREKLDGEEVVIFGIQYATITKYYKWEGTGLMEVVANQPFHAEKVGSTYHVLTEVTAPFLFESMDKIVTYDWRYLWHLPNSKIIKDSVEGIVLNINFKEYKVVRELTFTYKLEQDYIVDGKGQRQFMYKTPSGNVSIVDGFYDMVIHDRSQICTRVVKRRDDRVYPDSAQHIAVTREKSISYERLLRLQVLPEEDKIVSSLYSMFYFRQDLEVPYETVDVTTSVEELLGSMGEMIKDIPTAVEQKVIRIVELASNYMTTDKVVCHVEPICHQDDVSFNARNFVVPTEKITWSDLENMVVTKEVVGAGDTVHDRNEERNLSRGKLIIANFIGPRRKRKEYLSWSDAFCIFRSMRLKYDKILEWKENTVRIRCVSDSVSYGTFNAWCATNGIYLKDGFAYVLSMDQKQLRLGLDPNDMCNVLRISKRRKENRVPYRGYYLGYR